MGQRQVQELYYHQNPSIPFRNTIFDTELQWLPELFRLLLRLVDTFWYKGIPLIYHWRGLSRIETGVKGYPKHVLIQIHEQRLSIISQRGCVFIFSSIGL